VALTAVAILGGSQAGRPGEAGSKQVWADPDLAEPVDYDPQITALGFQKLAATCAGTTRMVSFEWHAKTGELFFDTTKMATPLMLPEDYASACLQPGPAAQREL
jgi:hypothetical protein